MVGESRSKELIFTGDRLNGEEAHKIGLVNHVLPDYAAACAKAFDMAQKIGEKGPIAIRAAKKAINGAEFDDLKKGLDFEAKCCEAVLVSEDRLEGLKAFAEKRKPVQYEKGSINIKQPPVAIQPICVFYFLICT